MIDQWDSGDVSEDENLFRSLFDGEFVCIAMYYHRGSNFEPTVVCTYTVILWQAW